MVPSDGSRLSLMMVHPSPKRTASLSAAETPPLAHPTSETEATMKRFWKNATVGQKDGSYTVLLDNRALKTPSGNTLLVPPQKSLVSTLIAAEWENQETFLKHHALPMVCLFFLTLISFLCSPPRRPWPLGQLTQW